MNDYEKELAVLIAIDKNILDDIPTDQKYNGYIETVLINEYGTSFIEVLNIPDYIDKKDIIIWEAEKILYENIYQNTYPEAFDEKKSKQYTLKKGIN